MNGEDFRTKLRQYHLRTNLDQTERIKIEEEKKMSHACSVKLYLEDHTLGRIGMKINKLFRKPN